MNRFEQYYKLVIRHELIHKLCLKKIDTVPQLHSIVVHMTYIESIQDKRNAFIPMLALEMITGQRANLVKAKRSIAGFHLRKGTVLGSKVTLRNESMYLFLEKLLVFILPRQREYYGFPQLKSKQSGFDTNGNFTFGIKDCFLFYELEQEYGKFEKLRGMDITIRTNTKNNIYTQLLLSAFQIPYTTLNGVIG